MNENEPGTASADAVWEKKILKVYKQMIIDHEFEI